MVKARQSFSNLRNPNRLFPRAIIDCLREAKSLLQIECANKSSFAKMIQLFTTSDAVSSEMHHQNGKAAAKQRGGSRRRHRPRAQLAPKAHHQRCPPAARRPRCTAAARDGVTSVCRPASRRSGRALRAGAGREPAAVAEPDSGQRRSRRRARSQQYGLGDREGGSESSRTSKTQPGTVEAC